MREIHLSAHELVNSLLNLSERQNVCLLDSCGVSYLESRLLIAGVNPVKTLEIRGKTAAETLGIFENEISQNEYAAIFTVSYDFGLKIENIKPRPKEFQSFDEPDVFLALFDCLIVHDYRARKTFLTGNEYGFDETRKLLFEFRAPEILLKFSTSKLVANFTRAEYLETIEKIKNHIRNGAPVIEPHGKTALRTSENLMFSRNSPQIVETR